MCKCRLCAPNKIVTPCPSISFSVSNLRKYVRWYLTFINYCDSFIGNIFVIPVKNDNKSD